MFQKIMFFILPQNLLFLLFRQGKGRTAAIDENLMMQYLRRIVPVPSFLRSAEE